MGEVRGIDMFYGPGYGRGYLLCPICTWLKACQWVKREVSYSQYEKAHVRINIQTCMDSTIC